jgi:hypothetical protein
VETLRGPAMIPLTLLAAVLAVASCSRSGGGPSAGETPSAAAATTPAAPAESPVTQAGDDEPRPGGPEFQPESAGGAVRGIPAPTNSVPIVAVANYFTELPGVDVAGLNRGQKEKFLQRVNSEICSCGCKNDTLARCYVNDPGCRLVKSLVQKVYDEVKAGK